MLGVHQGLPSEASDLFNHAKHLGADTFQVFLRNNRNMRMRTWNQYAIDNFNSKCFSSGIWSFVVYLKSYRQKRYQNYILEKISQKLSLISDSMDGTDNDDKYAYLTGDEDFEFSDDEISKIDNITNFNKMEKSEK